MKGMMNTDKNRIVTVYVVLAAITLCVGQTVFKSLKDVRSGMEARNQSVVTKDWNWK